MSTTAETQTQNATPNETAPKVISFGHGKYSGLMEECFHVMVDQCGLATDVAEKWAKSIGSQVGTLGEAISPTLGTSNVSEAKGKDKTVNYKEKGGTVKKVTETYPLRLHRILGKIVNLMADDVADVKVTLPAWVK